MTNKREKLMQLSKETSDILKNFSQINTNLVVKPGTNISTVSVSKDILAEYEGTDKFDKQISLFNLNEFLGVVGSFSNPDLVLDTKTVTIKEGKQKVTYMYADENLLTTPQKSITMPKVDISFTLSAADLAKLQKMSAILAVEDLTVEGDGKKLIAKVLDYKNPTGNTFELDLDTKSAVKFVAHFKVDKFTKLFPSEYTVEISSLKISKFSSTTMKLKYYLAVEADSTF